MICPKCSEALRDSMLTGSGRRIEYRLRHRSGHYVYLESQGWVLPASEDREQLLVVISRDISQRKELEEQQASLYEQQSRQAKAMAAIVHSADFQRSDVEQGSQIVLDFLCKTLGAESAELWRLENEEEGRFLCIRSLRADDAKARQTLDSILDVACCCPLCCEKIGSSRCPTKSRTWRISTLGRRFAGKGTPADFRTAQRKACPERRERPARGGLARWKTSGIPLDCNRRFESGLVHLRTEFLRSSRRSGFNASGGQATSRYSASASAQPKNDQRATRGRGELRSVTTTGKSVRFGSNRLAVSAQFDARRRCSRFLLVE